MKLLFDQNLSPSLVGRLSDLYPESAHVSTYDLDQAQDREIWQYASESGCLIVSKDSDFSEMSVVLGSPPKVIWIRSGNCSTDEIEDILRRDYDRVEELHQSEVSSTLLLY